MDERSTSKYFKSEITRGGHITIEWGSDFHRGFGCKGNIK